jgi:hypothetical protein
LNLRAVCARNATSAFSELEPLTTENFSKTS